MVVRSQSVCVPSVPTDLRSEGDASEVGTTRHDSQSVCVPSVPTDLRSEDASEVGTTRHASAVDSASP
jgi:hypothetical protein